MNTEPFAVVVLLIIVCVLSGLAGSYFGQWRLRRAERARFPLISVDLAEPIDLRPEYVCTITDWGEDFTGEDGLLPRYRWVLTQFQTGAVAMLGNSPSEMEAENDAARWLAGWDIGADMTVVVSEPEENP